MVGTLAAAGGLKDEIIVGVMVLELTIQTGLTKTKNNLFTTTTVNEERLAIVGTLDLCPFRQIPRQFLTN